MGCGRSQSSGRLWSMPDDKDTRSASLLEIPVEGATEVPSVYSDQARIQATTWDFVGCSFLETIVAAERPGTPTALPSIRQVMRANVVMTPAHAKAFLSGACWPN